jgi:uncharacterized protein YeaO (DUF488 family)
MKTSYFARLRSIDTTRYSPVSIAGKAPDWYSGYEYKVLAPNYDFLTKYKQGEIDADEYTRCFRKEILKPKVAQEIFDRLNDRFSHNGAKEVVLLCYEKPTDFCHRRLVAKWFESKLGIEVPELKL